MSYTLGNITLPNPVSFERSQVEQSSTLTTLDGTTKKDLTNRKETYILEFRHLTQTEVGNIMSEYNLQTTRSFSVNETNLNISSTTVHIEIASRQYNTKGGDYREDLTLILTETK